MSKHDTVMCRYRNVSSRKPFDQAAAQALGARIRSIRGAETQAAFAPRLGIDRATLANYESGRRIPNDAVLKELASISGRSVPSVLFGAHETPFEEYMQRIQAGVTAASRERPGFLPKFMFSDDEISIIYTFRRACLCNADEALNALAKLTELAEKSLVDLEGHFGQPPYGEAHVRKLRAAVEAGELEEGFDPDSAIFLTFEEERGPRG